MRKFLLTTIILASLAGVSGMARADNETDCNQGKDLDRQISGCTGMLQSQGLKASARALAYYNRGGAYAVQGKLDQAIADPCPDCRASYLHPEH